MDPTHLTGALKALADRLTAAGVPATIDPDLIQLPGALVTVDDIDAAEFGGRFITATAAVHLTAADTGMAYALDQLTRMLKSVLADGMIPIESQLQALTLPATGVAVPALTLTIEL
ncbi:hypothetical protein HW450_10340 [Corynebacterium hindlerae]|uniref:Uncharacterized protein n=1 Tax=Corynebacterium hindlerae TaxID=699041 RepID=A0A7G5FDP1_9CORY|nr:hypothetical protein [Corynebacterium hindlerae]QMV84732.1 hypothetical protein HW450_10340 [Corynebacterium hindlerae]